MNRLKVKSAKLKVMAENPSSGFTFIEIILYISIVSIMLTALIPYAWSVIGSSAKSATQEEVASQARFLAERIGFEIRNASGINSVSATSISLAETNLAVNPTVIDLSAGQVRITQGVGSAVRLHSLDTNVSNLTFTNYTSADNKAKNIQYVFTLGSGFNQARKEYQQSITVQSDAELRSN